MDRPPTYVVHSGYVTSQYDGQRHFIDQLRVMELYGIQNLPADRVVFYPTRKDQFFGWRDPENAVHLHPRRDGLYHHPERVAP